MKNNNKNKKRFGDRRDATLVRENDPLHIVMPYMYPNRCDNEAFIDVNVDITELKNFLDKKNENLEKGRKYTYFHCVITALLKTVVLRPEMNRFIQNKKLFQRNNIDFSFVIRRQFVDHSQEGLAYLRFAEDSNLDDIYERIIQEIFVTRKGKETHAESSLAIINKIPRFIAGFAVKFVNYLDRKGKEPKSLAYNDMSYSTVFISNVGSLGLSSGYHHLTNRGTNSIFALMGEAKYLPVFKEDGTYEMRFFLPIGFTIDERISDGFYCAKSIALMKKILANPEALLEKGVKSLHE